MNTMKNPPSGDQGLAFQTYALQMILFGPFYVRPQTVTVRYEIVSLQICIDIVFVFGFLVTKISLFRFKHLN